MDKGRRQIITWMGMAGAALTAGSFTASASRLAGGEAKAEPVHPLGVFGSPSNNSVVNINDFGAVGDGITDDSDAIQNAFDAVPVDGIVYIPSGIYSCGIAPGNAIECIKIAKKGVQIIGSGTLKRAPQTSAYLLRISADDIRVEGITFDGNRGAAGIPDGIGTGATIRAYGCTGGTISGCRFLGSPAQHIALGRGTHRWDISGNRFENFYSTAIQIGPEPSDQEGCHYNRIAFNHIKGDLPQTTRYCNGIFITSSSTTQAHDLKTCDHNVIIGNIVEDVADTGIESGYKCRFTIIMGNTITMSFNPGIYVRDNQYTTVQGNTIHCRTGHPGTVKQGIYVDGGSINGDPAPWTSAHCVVEGNTIRNGEVGGISVIAAQYSIVANNVIEGFSNTNGSSGINVKSGFVTCSNNIIRTYQFGIRLSLEANRALGNIMEAASIKDNFIEACRYGIFADISSVAMTLKHSDIRGNRLRNVTNAPIAFSTQTPTLSNCRLYDNQEIDEPYKQTDSQWAASGFITAPSGMERETPTALNGTITLFDKYVAGLVVLRSDNNETAVFITDGAGGASALAESAHIGAAGSAKAYTFEAASGSFILKKNSSDQPIHTIKATLL